MNPRAIPITLLLALVAAPATIADTLAVRTASFLHPPAMAQGRQYLEPTDDRPQVLPIDSRATIDQVTARAEALLGKGQFSDAFKLLDEAERSLPLASGVSQQAMRNFLTYFTYAAFQVEQTEGMDDVFARIAARAEATLGVDDKLTLVNLYNASVAAYNFDRFQRSADFLETALPRYGRVYGGFHTETYEVLLGLADAYFALEQHEKAEPIRRRVLIVAHRNFGATAPETLSAMQQHGWSLIFTFRIQEAERIARLLTSLKDNQRGKPDETTIEAYSLLSEALRLGMNLPEAERVQRKVVELCEQVLGPNDRRTIRERGRLAATLNLTGRDIEALNLQQTVHDTFLARLGPDDEDTRDAAFNLASILQGAGRQSDARQLLRAVLAASDATRHPIQYAQTLNALALSYQSTGDFERAEPLAREALELTAADGKQPAIEATIRASLGMTLAALGKNREADAMLAEAGAALRATLGQENYLANVDYAGRAVIALRAGRPADALGFARLALAEDRAILRTAQSQPGETREWWNTLTGGSGGLVARAAFLTAQGDPAQAEALFREAFLAVQTSQGSAAEAMRRSAARVASARAGLEDIVREWETAIAARVALDRSAAQSSSRPSSRHGLAFQKTVTERRRALESGIDRLEARINADFPDFFDLILPQAIGVDAIIGSGLIRENSALILFQSGGTERNGLVFAVTRQTFTWAEVPWTQPELAAKVATLRQQFAAPGLTRGAMALAPDLRRRPTGFDRSQAHALYNGLFGAQNITEVIAGKPDWIIVPRGPLLSLPFAALVTRPPEGADADPAALRETGWLGVDHALSILPSVSSLRQSGSSGSQNRSSGTPVFFGLGDPDFAAGLPDAKSSRSAPPDPSRILRTLSRLPGTRREVESLAAWFRASPGDVLLGAQATETALARAGDDGRLAAADVVLFATHGLVAGHFDGLAEPALALTPPATGPVLIDPPQHGQSRDLAIAEGARIDDGLLTASEAARLNLGGSLVILSACDTAASGRPDAEGLSGLARAFFFAGAGSLIVSHWQVRDDVAVRLTTEIVRRRSSQPGLPLASALQSAMVSIMSDTSEDATGHSLAHPAAWAPFHLVGAN